jgi:hypothetical protein
MKLRNVFKFIVLETFSTQLKLSGRGRSDMNSLLSEGKEKLDVLLICEYGR